jgi:nucleoside-diphosphate-sugar epimerase
MSVLVTGATGLIGSHLTAQLLVNGETVRTFVRKSSKRENILEVLSFYTNNAEELYQRIDFFTGDISDIFSITDALDGIHEVYHCAGMVDFNEKNINQLLLINETGTSNVINAALEKPKIRVCHVSSVATMPNHDKKAIIDESVFWKSSPKNAAYSISKYNAEREAWRGVSEGLDLFMVNPSIVLGAGCWNQSTGKIMEQCHNGLSFYTKGITGFVDVRDVVAVMIKLMKSNTTAERFILNGENIPYKKLLFEFHDAFGKKRPGIEANAFMLSFASLLDRFFSKERRLNKQVVESLLSKTYYSNKKITDKIGHQFYPISETINYVADKYKKHTVLKQKI